MIGIDADTNDLNRFIELLDSTMDEYLPERQKKMMNTLTREVVEQAQDYPPEGPANQPPPPYYKRGTGVIGAGGQILYRSGNLGQSWERRVSESGNTIEGRITNEATGVHAGGGTRTYPSFVQGLPKPGHRLSQSWFHRGKWTSVFTLAEAAAGEDVSINVKYSDGTEELVQDVINRLEK